MWHGLRGTTQASRTAISSALCAVVSPMDLARSAWLQSAPMSLDVRERPVVAKRLKLSAVLRPEMCEEMCSSVCATLNTDDVFPCSSNHVHTIHKAISLLNLPSEPVVLSEPKNHTLILLKFLNGIILASGDGLRLIYIFPHFVTCRDNPDTDRRKIYKSWHLRIISMDQIRDRIARQRGARYDEALQTVFTPWQINILQKLANDDPLSPAERQELSRRIKPKILAIDLLQDLKLIHPFFR